MPDYESRRQANADEGYERARITIADIEALTDGPLEAVPPVVVRTLAMQLLDVENQIKALGEACVGHVERLAEVEAERDALLSTESTELVEVQGEADDSWARAETAEARLAAVEALCDRAFDGFLTVEEFSPGRVRAAARGEGNRPAEDGPPP